MLLSSPSKCLAGLVTLAAALPIDDSTVDFAPQTALTLEYCTSKGLAGQCSWDLDVNLGYCPNDIGNIASIKVYDNFRCTLYYGSDCGGRGKIYRAGTYPNIGSWKSHECFNQ
ncbi:hypothetical protein BJ170DRAFT_719636 [Xylariales sp. AK1849]|nr:hypothetical protein BJ170DRAFT_719636 [Xylariales sp. AK1849]